MNYEELYQEIKQLEVPLPTEDVSYKDDWEQYEYLKEQYDKAKAMSLEEFTEVVKQRCLEDMQECAKQSITFENKGYVFSYFLSENGGWAVDVCFLVSKGEESYRMTFGFSVKDGKLSMGSSSCVTEVEWYDTVHEALDLYYLY